jgi:enamine deaminase RidA (YjgF/YER057c/UK114 family)
MYARLERTLEVLKRCLAEHGVTFDNLVKETIYNTNVGELLKDPNERKNLHCPAARY